MIHRMKHVYAEIQNKKHSPNKLSKNSQKNKTYPFSSDILNFDSPPISSIFITIISAFFDKNNRTWTKQKIVFVYISASYAYIA